MAKRLHGTGHLHVKWGSYYVRCRTSDGRMLNRKVGRVRAPGESDGLTRAQAEREFRRMQEAEERTPRPVRGAHVPTLDEVTDSLRRSLAIGGARRSYREGCESMQRVHISPALGDRKVTEVKTADVDSLASTMLQKGGRRSRYATY